MSEDKFTACVRKEFGTVDPIALEALCKDSYSGDAANFTRAMPLSDALWRNLLTRKTIVLDHKVAVNIAISAMRQQGAVLPLDPAALRYVTKEFMTHFHNDIRHYLDTEYRLELDRVDTTVDFMGEIDVTPLPHVVQYLRRYLPREETKIHELQRKALEMSRRDRSIPTALRIREITEGLAEINIIDIPHIAELIAVSAAPIPEQLTIEDSDVFRDGLFDAFCEDQRKVLNKLP